MTHLLDANVLIRLLNDDPAVVSYLRRSRAVAAISSIVLFEVGYGALRSDRVNLNLQRIADLPFDVLDFDRRDATVAGEIRASLAGAGTPIGPYDVLIAGQALARNLILVTHNTREFTRVTGLRLEDWQA